MISYSWSNIYGIVRHSRRRFSNFAGGGRQRGQRGGMYGAPKSHKTVSNATNDSPDATFDDKSSSCCFSNVSKRRKCLVCVIVISVC